MASLSSKTSASNTRNPMISRSPMMTDTIEEPKPMRGFPVFARLTHMAGDGRMRAVAEEIDHERRGLVRKRAVANVE